MLFQSSGFPQILWREMAAKVLPTLDGISVWRLYRITIRIKYRIGPAIATGHPARFFGLLKDAPFGEHLSPHGNRGTAPLLCVQRFHNCLLHATRNTGRVCRN